MCEMSSEAIKSPREINEAVARKLGWTIDKLSDFLPWYGRPDSHPLSTMIRELPNYCSDISAAWEIMEKQTNNFCVFRDWDTGEWCVRYDDGAFNTTRHDFEFVAADTAPMAICLAFLKLPDPVKSPA